MACNRLYIYNPIDNEAVMLSKGFGTWQNIYDVDKVNKFLAGTYYDIAAQEVEKTLLELRTEADLPDDANVI